MSEVEFFPDGSSPDVSVTLWFLDTDEPLAEILARHPRADRGFARKFLSQFNPAWPVTPIGQFALNRSAPAAEGEFYIGGYPGFTVMQLVITDQVTLSDLSERLLTAFPAQMVFAIARNEDHDFGAVARWSDGKLQRAFSGTRTRVFEDIGLPEPFEGPLWASENTGGIDLPFDPVEFANVAESQWSGLDTSKDGPDLNVAAFAVDGRPAPRIDDPSIDRRSTVEEYAAAANARMGLGPANADYDDYEDESYSPATGEEFSRFAQASVSLGRRVGRDVGRGVKRMASRLRERLRHIDRD